MSQVLNRSDDINKAVKIINDFVYQNTKEYLNNNEQAIIQGSLKQLSYKSMQQEYLELKFYALDYIARNLAYDLWKKLTVIARSSSLFNPKYRVSKTKVWIFVNDINQGEEKNNTEIIDIPAATMEGIILRGRYQIEEHLFDRDSGERQFLARDRHLGDRPCLVIQRSHQTPRVIKQFEREGKALSQIGRHSQLPDLLAYFKEQQYLYLVYQYISGTALTELLTEKSWSESAVKFLLQSLLSILEFIQQHDLTHRNINPDNIIQVGNQWILTDFACIKEIHHSISPISHSTFAQGMNSYMSPEQHMGMANFTSDIYAVGMIAVHALTGIHPRKLKKYNPQTGNKIWRDQAQVSLDFADVIDCAISYQFSDRYRTAQEMLESLKNLA
ncbi:MAG: protein kinase [Cyanobacteria bacterium P01_A01_bin.40]